MLERVKNIAAYFFCVVMIGFSAKPAMANVIFTGSVNNTSLSYQADLKISGGILTIELSNTSTPSQVRAECLSSFFFDIYNGSSRPTLSLLSATGQIYYTDKDAPDVLQADTNLVGAGQNGKWAYQAEDPTKNPYYGFGISAVGNSGLPSPNNFFGNMVGGSDYSIYVGDVTTNSLKELYLVKDKATFTFSVLGNFTEANISSQVLFGLGTAPDALVVGNGPTPGPVPTVPTPTAAISGLALMGGLLGVAIRRKINR